MRSVILLTVSLPLAFLLAGCKAPDRGSSISAERRDSDVFFPIGLYGVNSTNDFATVREAGFNVITGPADAQFLNAAQQIGLKVLVSPGTSAGLDFQPATVSEAVKKFDSHPALWAWYIIDEPDFNDVSPELVKIAQRQFEQAGARKPTALVLYNGAAALHYAHITDYVMIDRYPIPWLPLANFSQHVRMTRLALRQNKPLIAVIQAFDWNTEAEMLQGEKNFRPPTYEELRCMTYSALAERATGIFYFAFDTGRWRLPANAPTWEALQRVVREMNARLPLFTAQHLWWSYEQQFNEGEKGWNASYQSAITAALLSVKSGSSAVPAGKYVLTVNTTDRSITYRVRLGFRAGRSVQVLGEKRMEETSDGWLEDEFQPYEVHVYGPLLE